MKTYFIKPTLLLAAIIVCYGAYAQSFTFTPDNSGKDTKVVIKNFFADITIEGTSTSDIVIEAEEYEGLPEKAKGLKPLSALGPENTGIGLNVTQSGNEILITGASRKADEGTYIIKLPKGFKLDIDFSSWQSGDLLISGMANEVNAKSQIGDLYFESVTGPVVASTLSSDIVVDFSNLNQAFPTSIVSTSGDIDITLPANSKGTFDMSSISGEVYTDMDFEFAKEGDMRRFAGGMSAKANLNGGGVRVSLKCVSGDLFIRKK